MNYGAAFALLCAVLLFGCAGLLPFGIGQKQALNSTAAQFVAILNEQPSLQYTVVYNVSAISMAVSPAVQQTEYAKGSDQSRVDTSDGTVRIYGLNGTGYECVLKDENWTCVELGADSTPILELERGNMLAHIREYDVIEDGTMQVAEVSASCYNVTGAEGGLDYFRACYSPEGVPLYVDSLFRLASWTFVINETAISYSPSVLDSDFVLPAQPIPFPSNKRA